MVELRKQEKEEKSLRREQVSKQFYFNNSEIVNCSVNYMNLLLFFVFVLKLSIITIIIFI